MLIPGAALPPALVCDGARFCGEIFVVSDQNAAFSGGHVLRLLKAEGPKTAERTDGPILPACAVSVRGIFNNNQVVLARYCKDGIHVGRMAAKMHGNDGARG